MAALAGASVAIAAGLGAFNGINAAQQAQTGANVLPPGILAQIKQMNEQAAASSTPSFQVPQLLPDTARILGRMADGSPVYALTDTHGELCTISEAGGGCGPPLSNSHPITAGFANVSPTTGGTFIASGVALDGVTSVSFAPSPGNGQIVTVPVSGNIWVYKESDSHAIAGHCITVHFANGSTAAPFPEVPCP